MAKGTTAMEVRADGVAVITISNPPVNALSLDVMASLQRNYAEALSRSDVKAIVLTGAKGRFCGGFDITVFGKKPKNEKPGSLSIDFLSDVVEDARKPSVAAIDGIALGGGLEVAMVCHARISTPSAQLGLPELQLGIIPGMGGTQRLPRLVGLQTSLELMLVILKEVNEQFLSAGIKRVKGNLQSFVGKGQLTQEDCENKFSLLSGVLDYEQFRDADLVIEAVIEDALLKQQIFSDLSKYCHHDCILATNTSTIDLNLIGQKTISQDRIVGAHFFSPAHVMPLLEIVRTHQTSSQVVVDLLDVAKKIRKTPIVVGNCTGFAVNRMFFPYGQAASFLVDYGLDVYHIDHVITQFGMPMGPFRLADLVGFGVAIASKKQYFQSYPERCYKSMLLLQIMLEDNRTGESARKGFYVYDDKRRASRDPDLRKYIDKSRNMAGVTQDPQLMKLTDNDIVEIILFPVVNEACRVLDEGISLKASDLDVASVMGMGFPSYRGGVMFWADSLGAKYVYARLEAWSKDYGDFFKPCEYLAARARQGASLAAKVDIAKSRL
nr:unnamed protein product [Digitaria exilis]